MLLYKKFTAAFIIFVGGITYGQFSWQTHFEQYEKLITKINTPKPLNILFVVSHFPCPSQTFVLNIITQLIDRGHNISIFSFHKDDLLFAHPNVEKYKLLDRVMYEEFPEKLPKCDIVFCQFGYLGLKIFEMDQLAQWLRTKKVVVCFRGSDISAYIKDDPKIYQQVFKKADLFLPVCDYFKRKLILLGCKKSKIIVHHSAIDCSQFFFTAKRKPQKNTIHLVSVCRLVKKKGIDYALKAFAQIAEKYQKIHYTIIGDGPEADSLKSLVVELNLQDKVTFCGWKAQDEIVSILDKSHIFLSPSIRTDEGDEEGIANALKEAMAMGLIVVGSWHAGTSELIDHGVSGFLTFEKDVSDLAQIIMYILEHPKEWKIIGETARKKIEDEFEINVSIENLEKLFYRLLDESTKEKNNTEKIAGEIVV